MNHAGHDHAIPCEDVVGQRLAGVVNHQYLRIEQQCAFTQSKGMRAHPVIDHAFDNDRFTIIRGRITGDITQSRGDHIALCCCIILSHHRKGKAQQCNENHQQETQFRLHMPLLCISYVCHHFRGWFICTVGLVRSFPDSPLT